jgi:hypothetical protein
MELALMGSPAGAVCVPTLKLRPGSGLRPGPPTGPSGGQWRRSGRAQGVGLGGLGRAWRPAMLARGGACSADARKGIAVFGPQQRGRIAFGGGGGAGGGWHSNIPVAYRRKWASALRAGEAAFGEGSEKGGRPRSLARCGGRMHIGFPARFDRIESICLDGPPARARNRFAPAPARCALACLRILMAARQAEAVS